MERGTLAGLFAAALVPMLDGTQGISQSQPPTEGPAVGATPAWFLQGSFPDPTGRATVDANGNVAVPPRTPGAGAGNSAALPPGVVATPACRRSPVCGNRLARSRQS